MKLETFKITYMGKMQIIMNLFQEMIQTVNIWNALVKKYYVDKKSELTWMKKVFKNINEIFVRKHWIKPFWTYISRYLCS